ncbi:interferon phi 1 [Anarhichas minor]|uniref:interferon a3-like n=1 Tax=Anarrhichthys ocellatus TaxID=433405 RepID=UPI0012EE2D74|nr:interferon a3-like [Anarrhichthys ocellatus]XP_031735848.1 interferon a3-like [Anarrhichthys ocellatus]
MTSWTRLILVLLCSAVTPVLCCDWLRHYGHLSNISLTLVQVMGGQLTDQESPVPFPYRLYERIRKDEVESQLVFIRDSLELIAGLYHHDNRSSVTWDTDKTERFLMTIDRQTDGLKSCVSTHSRKNMSRQRRYYRRLENSTLYRTGGSPESWELIRKETKLHLEQLDLLAAFVVDSSAASRRRSTETRH